MTVEASVDPLRFDVVLGVAVVASEKHAVGFVVSCAFSLRKATIMGRCPLSSARAVSGVVVPTYFIDAVALVEFPFDFCWGPRFVLVVGALNDYLVWFRVELGVGCFRR